MSSAATHEDVDDELVQALLPFGERAVEPLLKLYEELGEEQGSDIAFLLAGLRVRDPRVLALLLDRLEFDAADGALPGAVSTIRPRGRRSKSCWPRFPRKRSNCGAISSMPCEELEPPAPHVRAEPVRHPGRVSEARAARLRSSERSGTDGAARVAGCGDARRRRPTASSTRNSIPRRARRCSDWLSPIRTPRFAARPGHRWPTPPKTRRSATRCSRS